MKERLTGAIILVALIVLLVPELLTGPPRMKRVAAGMSARVAAHPTAQTPVHRYTLPLEGGAAARMAAIEAQSHAVPQPAAPTSKSASPPSTVLPPKAAQTATAPVAKPATPVPATPVPPPQPKAQSKPRPKSRTPSTAELKSKLRTRPAALLRPMVRRRVARSEPVRSTHGTAAWTVQMGVFAYRADALRLVREARTKGILARISPLHLRGRLLWRVSSGSARSRAGALAVLRRLRARGFKGALLGP